VISLNSKEVKIFLTFLVIYSFFIYWSTWSEESSFALTKAIVDENKFEIDSFYNQTGDRVFYNNHYYTDKFTGLSFLSSPIYFGWKIIYMFFSNNFRENFNGTNEYIAESYSQVVHYLKPGVFELSTFILITIFTSSLFSALTILLLYRISNYFTREEKYRLLLIITCGLGTLMFPYALIFLRHSTASFLSFLTFFLIFRSKQEKIQSNKILFLGGLLIGYGIITDLSILIIAILFLVYLFFNKGSKLQYFLIGIFIAYLPMLFYAYSIFGSFLSYAQVDATIWGLPSSTNSNFIISYSITDRLLNYPFILLRLIIYPSRGLFFYYPILFFSFIGLYYMYQEFRLESILFFSIFLLILSSFSMSGGWWGGLCFGPRHLTVVIPFLSIPLIYVFKKINLKIILPFICISIFVNFLGLQTLIPHYLASLPLYLQYRYNPPIVSSFQIMDNPISDHYFPLFLKNGPRSRIFENIIDSIISGKFKLDIRHWSPQFGDADQYLKHYKIKLFSLPFGTMILKIPFLCLIPLFIVFFLIWRKDLLNMNEIKRLSRKRIITIYLILLLIFFLLFIRIE
jgi:hypothetical protein